jgi:hypothetical protein
MIRYIRKQFTIAIVFIFILAIIAGGIYVLTFRPPKGTCFDGIQNQGEKDIDCGGPCGPCSWETRESLEIIWQRFIPTIENNFDLIAEIKNPNKEWGVESVSYIFNLFNEDDQIIASKQGKTYLLPQETRQIIEPRLYSITEPVKVEIELKEAIWQRLKDFEDLDLRIKEKEHRLVDNKFSQVSGVVENRSNYDLAKIEIRCLLFNKDQRIIAVGKTEMRTVLISEARHFQINWPYNMAEEVSSFELKPYTNVFLDENFMKKYGTPERFKEYQ